MLLSVLAKAQAKIPHRLYGVCLMANHLHLLIRPDDASQLPRLMHWVGWYSAMALNRLAGHRGHGEQSGKAGQPSRDERKWLVLWDSLQDALAGWPEAIETDETDCED